MAQPYVGEIRLFAGNFAPAGWAICDGTPQAISENETLFQLIGTTYGGDGQSTFNLPDLRSRVPLHQGTGPDGTTYQIGEMAGVEQVTLTTQQIPNHTHPMLVTTTGQTLSPSNSTILATPTATGVQGVLEFASGQTADQPLNGSEVAIAGGSQPHENRQPYLALNFIISLFGIFPSPT